MEKLKFMIAIIKTKYYNFTDYLYNMALFYFEFGYKEAKIFLFLYALFNFNLKIYRKEKENFTLMIEDSIIKLLSSKKVIFYSYRSKIVEIIVSYFKYIKESIIFSENIIINILLIPYFLYKRYKTNKQLKYWENYIKNRV
ncbi:hypothetical protein [uncultured Fusobacterium sp.]|uniref:hypothetical protein n=1 Tax=uncultured Fusobacterium sp. TaxID=159267 RepID=UPI0027DDF78A|nr:hypothetical protein [uncultured Fusobacterium sp.]